MTHADPEVVLGLDAGAAHLVLYDARWTALFLAEAERIAAALGPLARAMNTLGAQAFLVSLPSQFWT